MQKFKRQFTGPLLKQAEAIPMSFSQSYNVTLKPNDELFLFIAPFNMQTCVMELEASKQGVFRVKADGKVVLDGEEPLEIPFGEGKSSLTKPGVIPKGTLVELIYYQGGANNTLRMTVWSNGRTF